MVCTASLKVFLADDSAPIRERIAALLAGPDVAIVGQGATPGACVEAILATRPDVVVLDVQLEGGTGLQVLRAVRAAAPEIAFVVFSNSAHPAYRERYLAAGAANFLDKAGESGRLAAAVAQAGGLAAP